MGKFKEFLITEHFGLGELGVRMDNLFNSQTLGNTLNGVFLTSDMSGSDQQPPFGQTGAYPKADIDITIPSVQKSGRIVTLMIKKNPIYVRLSDGTEAHFSYDEYKRIQGKPAIGKTMMITFQRHPSDVSKDHSKIDKAIVLD